VLHRFVQKFADNSPALEVGKGKKVKGLDTCYSIAYLSQTRDQQCFTISEVAADWHEPIRYHVNCCYDFFVIDIVL